MNKQEDKDAFLKQILDNQGDEGVKVAQEVYNWAKRHNLTFKYGGTKHLSFRPLFDYRGIICNPIGLYALPKNEGLAIYLIDSDAHKTGLSNKPPFDGGQKAFELKLRLEKLVESQNEPDDRLKPGKNPRLRWYFLKNENGLKELFHTLDWCIHEIKSIKDKDVKVDYKPIEGKSYPQQGDYLPTKDDFESAYRMLCSPGQRIGKDSILDLIKINAINSGRNLKLNWRLITEKNIEIWVKEATTLDPR